MWGIFLSAESKSPQVMQWCAALRTTRHTSHFPAIRKSNAKKHSSVADPPPPSPPDPHFKGRFSPGGEARAVETAPEGPPATKSACADCPDPAWHRGLLIKKTTLVRGLGE